MFIPIHQRSFVVDVKKSNVDCDVDFFIYRLESKDNRNLPQRYLDAALHQIWSDVRKEFLIKHYMDVLDEITLDSARNIVASRLRQIQMEGGVDVSDSVLVAKFEEENEEATGTETIGEDRGFRFRAKVVESSESEDWEEFYSSRRTS